MKYKQLELALAAVHRIDDKGLKTFRARLRHLRNLGVPDVPKPGSGGQVEYTDEHAHQLVIALELEAFDWDPAHAADLVKSRWPALKQWCEEARINQGMFLAMHPDFIGESYPALGRNPEQGTEAGLGLYTRDQVCSEIVSRAGWDLRRLIAVNLSDSLRWLHGEIEKAGIK